jgi:hypothetical protein
MDIGSGNGYPAGTLSNFGRRTFYFDGVLCNSMEGLLQAFKFQNPDMQAFVCSLYGIAAKMRGKNKKWWKLQKLYWRGKEIDRHSKEYQDLLDRAYQAMYDQCEGFRKALAASGNATLTHSIGKHDASHTVLTVQEFCSRLTKLREGQVL